MSAAKNDLAFRFVVNVKSGPYGKIVIVTDQKILGKKFEEGKLQLDFTQRFYQGEEKNSAETKEMMLAARHLHLSGEDSVALGWELKLVDENKILRIKKIPHAEVILES